MFSNGWMNYRLKFTISHLDDESICCSLLVGFRIGEILPWHQRLLYFPSQVDYERVVYAVVISTSLSFNLP